MKKFGWTIILLSICLIILGRCYFSYRHPDKQIKVQFEFVGCLSKNKPIEWDYWFMVNDNQGTDFGSKTLANFCDFDSLEIDFDEYTYIIVDGHELVSLCYNLSDCRRRFSPSPDYYGYATLKAADDRVYVYRIPCELPVIKDMHAHYDDDFRTTIF